MTKDYFPVLTFLKTASINSVIMTFTGFNIIFKLII